MDKNNEYIARQILEDEIKGDVEAALKKMHEDYSMTWVYKRRDGVLFPADNAKNIRKEMEDVYVVKGRRYDIKHLLSQNDIVMIEMMESYPDEENPEKVYRTPLVLVLEFKDGKVWKGRHYCDPQLSYENLTPEDIKKIYRE